MADSDIDWGAYQTKPRNVTAVCWFAGEPGRERDAAEAWAFELTYYFTRGVGEQPRVTYEGGLYRCEGMMTTTHPGDKSPVSVFSTIAEPWHLDYSMDPRRQRYLRGLYGTRPVYFDGRDHS